MLYIYDKSIGKFQTLDTTNYVLVDSKEMEKLTKEHEFDINSGFGEIILKEDKPVFNYFITKMYVNKETLQFSLAGEDAKSNEYFDVVEVKVKDFFTWEQKRQILSGQAMIMYWDNEFHEVGYQDNYYFDTKTKTMKLDESSINYNIETKLSLHRLEDEIRHRGFEISIGGNNYLQPFRTNEDRNYLESMERYVQPELREIKLFKNLNNERDPLQYDLLKGEVISNEFLGMIISKILIAESHIKTIIQKIIDEVLTIKNLDEKIKASENVRERIYEELRKVIK